jgi:hypothetical protein
LHGAAAAGDDVNEVAVNHKAPAKTLEKKASNLLHLVIRLSPKASGASRGRQQLTSLVTQSTNFESIQRAILNCDVPALK